MALRVHHVRATASTMDDARALALAGAEAGTCVRADRQTGGRGRADRTWVTLPGSLAFSVVLRPRAPPARWGLLPIAAGVAVAEALRSVDRAASIKWPNDVRIGGRKVAGILVEAQAPTFAVVGVGINAGSPEDLPADLRERAGALALDAEAVDALFRAAAEGLVAQAEGLDRGETTSLREAWVERSETIGTVVERAGRSGTAVGLDEDGALLLRGNDGATLRLIEAE